MQWTHWLGSVLRHDSSNRNRALFSTAPRYPKRRQLINQRQGVALVEHLETRTLLTTFGVNSFADAIDALPGDGVSDAGQGVSTLRSAIMEANTSFGNDIINLGAGVYTLTLAGQGEDAAATGDLDITDNLTIIGNSASTTFIDANNLDRVFDVHNNVTLTLVNVTVRNGFSADEGGGIRNFGRLTLTDSTVTENESSSKGGGIYNESILILNGSIVSDNTATLQGGGIYNGNQLTVTGSTFSGNSAGVQGGGIYNTHENSLPSTLLDITGSIVTQNSAGSRGGGIFNDDQLTLTRTTVSNNTAGSRGGGIYNQDVLTVQQSTLSGNSATSRGGGLFNAGTSTISNSTISTNTTLPGTSASEKQGGGILNDGVLGLTNVTITANAAEAGGGVYNLAGSATLRNTIIAANSATTIDADVSGNFLTEGHNLIGDVATALGFTVNTNGDLIGGNGNPVIDPRLGPLQNNGGATATHDLLLGSPAIDKGDGTNTTATDQRDFLRLVDGDRNGTITIDIGAVEFQTPPLLVRPTGTVSSTTPTFEWSAITGAVKYDLWVNDLTTGQSGVIREKTLTSTTFTPATPLIAGHSYLWTVRAIYANGFNGAFAAAKDFSVASSLGTPTLAAPVGTTATVSPTFSWSAIAGAIQYDLWVNNLTTGQSAVIRNTAVNGTEFTPSISLTRGHSYLWTVRAIGSGGSAGLWATAEQFTVQTLTAPTLTSPVGPTIDRTPTFTWSAVDSAARYDIWVNNLTTGQVGVIRDTNVALTSYTTSTPLTIGHSYIWTVRAFSAASEPGDWATHATFTVTTPDQVTPPTLISPSGITIDSTPTFRWQPVTGAALYEIAVDNVTTGQNDIIRVANVNGTSYSAATALSVEQTYRWRVRAINEDGLLTAFSQATTFVVKSPANVPAPTLVDPIGPTIDATPRFIWNEVPGASRYEIRVDNLTTSQTNFINESNITGTSFTTSTPLNLSHQFLWTVRAFNDSGFATVFAPQQSFQIVAPGTAAPPTLQTPLGNTIDRTPTFSWSKIGGAARYDLWVNDQTTGQSGIIRETNVLGTSYTPTTPLIVGHTYLWTVRAITDDPFFGQFSPQGSFTVAAPSSVSAPTIVTPVGTVATTQPTFQWTAVNGAARYDVWVNDLTTGQIGVVRNQNVTGTTFVPTTPLPTGHSYLWTVRAINDEGQATDWTTAQEFAISGAVGKPTLLTPSGTTSDTTPTFVWTTVAGAVRYDLWVNDLTTGQSGVIRNANITSTNYTSVPPLIRGHQYIWTVRAFNSGGESGNWATHKTFTVTSLTPASQRFDALTDEETDWDPKADSPESKPLETIQDADQQEHVIDSGTLVATRNRDTSQAEDHQRRGAVIDDVMAQWMHTDWWNVADEKRV